jgi:hypothetical protein
MEYEVIKAFTDKNKRSADSNGNKHIYWEGDTYPFKKYAGATVQSRLDELISGGFIKEV